jgi:hypothetical protein
MVSIVKNFNTDLNFWEANPIFKTIKEFKEIFDKDKSRKKEDSSQLMWAIALFVDPNPANNWRNLTEKEKKELINSDFHPDINWEDHNIRELIEIYENRCLTIAEKELVRFERKLVDRGNFIDRTTYTLDNYDPESNKLIKGTAEQLDKMMLNTSKLNEQYRLIKDALAQEANEGELRAGAKESATEKGVI